MLNALRSRPWYRRALGNAMRLHDDAGLLLRDAETGRKRRAASAFVLDMHATEQIGYLLLYLWRELHPRRYGAEVGSRLHLRKVIAASALVLTDRAVQASAKDDQIQAMKARAGARSPEEDEELRVLEFQLDIDAMILGAQMGPHGFFGKATESYYSALRMRYLYVDEPTGPRKPPDYRSVSRKEVRKLLSRTSTALKLLKSDAHVTMAEELYHQRKIETGDFTPSVAARSR